ncbi:MAG: RHS repeat domain-containing protein [Devosia sp.]
MANVCRQHRPALRPDQDSFTYDLGGKLLTNSAVGSYTYPTQGSTALQPHAVQTAGAWAFAYDLNGNQLSRTTSGVLDREIAYDNDNRPTTVTQGPSTVTYLYGPDGERLKKLTATGTTLYLQEAELDPAGGWTTYPVPEAKRVNGVWNWLHRDHLSSVRRITDASGVLTRSSVYKPYGEQVETVLQALSPSEPKGWIGEITDPETGLTYLHARYYDSALGRFLSPDWWDAADPGVGTDRFGYSLGDPINKNDPSGHILEECALSSDDCEPIEPKIEEDDEDVIQVAAGVPFNPMSGKPMTEQDVQEALGVLDGLAQIVVTPYGTAKDVEALAADPTLVNTGILLIGVIPGGKLLTKGAKLWTKTRSTLRQKTRSFIGRSTELISQA